MSKIYIGIDNGVTGTIAFLKEDESVFVKTPVKTEQSYTKTKQKISRLDFLAVHDLFREHVAGKKCFAVIERPMVNPGRFKAGLSAVRCLESTLILLEHFDIPYQYIDSKQWQKELLPKGIMGAPELKSASQDIGIRFFPQHETLISKHGDADALLMAEWARRFNL